MNNQLPRRFHLVRDADETGVSGVGVIVEGIEFTDGTVALRWLTGTTSTAIYATIADVETIHGHGGKTRVVWLEDHMAAGLMSLIEGKNTELKRHHLAARIGDLNGSAVRDIVNALNCWDPDAVETSGPFHALWHQVHDAAHRYDANIQRVRREADRDIPGVGETTP